MTERYDVIVIGAGANGLVAAAALGRAGLRALVLERGETLAGQAGTLEFAPGFRAAPLALDAGWVPPVVERGLGLDGLERTHADTPLTVAVAPGELLPLSRDPARAAAAIRRYSAADAARWPAFTARLRQLAGFLEAVYQLPAPDLDTASVREALPLLGLARRFRSLGREAMTEFLRTAPMPARQIAEEWFEAAPLRTAVAAGGVLDNRQGPLSGGTGFVLLHNLVGAAAGSVRGRGAWRAGPDAFAAAAERAARRHGATIRTGADVARIRVEDDAVAGVALRSGEEIRAARVLSAADPAHTLLGLVDPVWLDPELLLALRNIRFRGCTAYVLFALGELPDLPGLDAAPDALRGTVSLTADVDVLERAADAAKYGTVPERPHIELTVPSLSWPELAPAGRHVLVARAHYAPYRLRAGLSWDAAAADALGDAVASAIEAVSPCFSSRVLHRATLTPPDLEVRFGLTEGAATHGEIALDQILFMRPTPGLGHYATPIDGLYLGGAGTHPGPAIAGGPGWLAAQRLLADRSRARPSR
ncbi:MAG TPA: NAD(P)/FAD-dependent oxidoreductase [Longimicrobiales bacterium]|nr:NAD(P)/FAD-dependent oxidoreductase [Longimicrobiales bacterium]